MQILNILNTMSTVLMIWTLENVYRFKKIIHHHYFRALQAFGGSYFGHGNGSILLDDLICTGHEKSVDNCRSGGWYKSNCGHSEDAGVACVGKDTNLNMIHI